MKVCIGRLLFDDYVKRGVFEYITHAGAVDLDPTEMGELFRDAVFNSDPDCIDDIPANYRGAYKRLACQLSRRCR